MKKGKLKKYQIGKPSQQLTPTGQNTLWELPNNNTPNRSWAGLEPQNPELLTSRDREQDVTGVYANAAGYTLGPDGKSTKKEITEDKNKQQYSGFFQALNPLLDLTQLIANGIGGAKNSERERKRLLDARYMSPQTNPYEKGLNNVPVYMGSGGNIVNNTGYLKGEDTNKNLVNIIPSSHITTQNMAFPIIANGVALYPNTGDYKFDSRYVVEHPMIRSDKKMLESYGAKKYQEGGQVEEVQSVPEGQANGMLEQGEVFLNNQGDINKVAETEDRHEAESGGSPQADVSRVLEDTADKRKDKVSKLLLIKPSEAEALVNFKPKRSVTHSKLYEMVVADDDRKLRNMERKVKANLNYVDKKNGGIYAKNSLDENLRLLQDFPTRGTRFDAIYQHQEAVKKMYGIEQEQNNQYGGLPVAQNGRRYSLQWKNYYDNQHKGQFTAPTNLTPTQFYSTPGVLDYIKGLDKMPGFDNDMGVADDGVWGYRHQLAYDKFFSNNKASRPNITKSTTITPSATPATVTPSANTTPSAATNTTGIDNNNATYKLPSETKASTVNEGLGWSGGYGNMLTLLDSFGRTPVNFEQMSRDYYQVHEENAAPIINANTGDYNAAVAQLPQNGVGYANQANLQGQKYKFNNEALAGVESRNKQKYDARDADVEQKKFQLDSMNLGLREQARQQILVGKEKQRQQKFESLKGLFEAIDNKNAFNRNANTALQLTPFFDANGNFNGNKYQIGNKYNTNDGGRVEYIQDKNTGQQFRVIYDKDGKIMSSSKVTTDNKSVGSK